MTEVAVDNHFLLNSMPTAAVSAASDLDRLKKPGLLIPLFVLFLCLVTCGAKCTG